MVDGLEQEIAQLVADATNGYLASLGEPEADFAIELQLPRKPEHGDWAANVAMRLAKPLRKKPLEIAEGIVAAIASNELLSPPEVAPPGFINLRIAPAAHERTLGQVLNEKDAYGQSDAYAGQKLLIEFVSANPTGPLHFGHGRNAIVGDTLARIYAAAGFEVAREYYFNDAGVQMNNLGKTMRTRYLQQCGQDVELFEDAYKGDYMIEIAKELHAEVGDSKVDEPEGEFFIHYAADRIMEWIRKDLATLDIHFDKYFSESALHKSGQVEQGLATLREKNLLYEKEGAEWFRTTDFGDDEDRVVRKSDGNYTYLAPDVAYHHDKFGRGFTRLVNVLGADHKGYVPRLKASAKGMGHDPDALHCVLLQMVGVKEGGEHKKLSTRAGDFVPLGEVLQNVGPDIVRFFFVMRAANSQLTFDVDLAKQKTMDNPYYYVQYAHARCCSLLGKAKELGIEWNGGTEGQASLLTAPEEQAILFQIARLPRAIVDAARKDEPLGMTTYLRELATSFHSYFSAGSRDASLRVLQEDNLELTQARLTLIVTLKQTLANALKVLGLHPIDRL